MSASRWILLAVLLAALVGVGAVRALGIDDDDAELGEVVLVSPTVDPGGGVAPAPAGTSRPPQPAAPTSDPPTPSRTAPAVSARSAPPSGSVRGAPRVTPQPPLAGDDDDDDDGGDDDFDWGDGDGD